MSLLFRLFLSSKRNKFQIKTPPTTPQLEMEESQSIIKLLLEKYFYFPVKSPEMFNKMMI